MMEPSSIWPLSVLLRTRDQFALFFVSSFAAKLLHFHSHRTSLPVLLLLLYTPTFFLPDLLLVLVGRLLVFRPTRGRTWRILGGLLALLTASTSTSQICFYLTTGGEVQWMAAGNLAADPAGLTMLLSELPRFATVILAFSCVAWLVAARFYAATSWVLVELSGYEQLDGPCGDDVEPSKADRAQIPSLRRAAVVSVAVIAATLTVLILQCVRPRSAPYAHMSGSLPITLFESLFFSPINADFCLPHPTQRVDFPFEQYQKVVGHAPPPDWKPLTEECRRRHRRPPPPPPPGHGPPPPGYPPPPPPPGWFEDEDGFGPWDPLEDGVPPPPPPPPHRGHRGSYEPSCDPMKLSNLDESLLHPLTDALKQNKPSIRNVLLVTLESTRKDMFPFKKATHAYDTILASYGAPEVADELDKKLWNLTATASFLTGESTRFENDEAFNETANLGAWTSQFGADKGGINVQGAITGSAYTLKSLITSICGMEPLPVDFTEEVRGRMYQPCMPQILDMLNKAEQGGRGKTNGNDFQSSPWDWAFMQSVTDQFDSQYTLNEQIGFRTIVTDETLDDPASAHYPPKQPRNNYFGFPEEESLPYLRDAFANAKRDGRRLFASYMTSTTHHPFGAPAVWPGKETYLAKRRFAPENYNHFDMYLNTIKYQDGYLDSLLSMLHEEGALNETLVVMVGDHGLAFDVMDGSRSNFENGHISNFPIPLLFLHPELPRVQLDAADAATPTSIIPTMLDLLLQTDSLSDAGSEVARGLLPRYQGHSMIREQQWSVPIANHSSPPPSSSFFHDHHAHNPWDDISSSFVEDATFPTANASANTHPFHFSTINPGGSLLAISQAYSSYRLILPLCSTLPLRFTDLASSPNEAQELVAWNVEALVKEARKSHGDAAAAWADLARRLGEWWFWEQRRRWGYHLPARSTDRGVVEGSMAGRIRKKHWWET